MVDPASAALRAALLPDRPERVVGDDAAPVSLPAPTISQAPGETLDAAARVLATWLLFQAAMGVGLGGGHPGLRRLAWVLALNATVLSLVGIVQMFAGNGKLLWVVSPPYETRTAVGPFVRHTHFAEVLNLGLHAIDRLPADTGLPQAERHQAQAALGDRGPASSAMKAALALEPDRYLWRKELVGRLLEWGDPDEAHSQALVAAHLAPGSADAEALIRLTADAVARGRAGPLR